MESQTSFTTLIQFVIVLIFCIVILGAISSAMLPLLVGTPMEPFAWVFSKLYDIFLSFLN
ncbi:hypothetical protein [Methanococcus maripaludis]|uniref:Uncharacterized protein n=1 Tax=Methanococcus maripaludis TaxID=39152 RepID=A0A7J9PN27_METMI|nr:hypothetical protein [Methanococcus maripaludis]MBA2862899.1 hypothetical protein [Methanococcus maripaludis]